MSANEKKSKKDFGGKERREYVRVPAEYDVVCYRFAFGQGRGISKMLGRAKDLSATGLLFESDKKYEKGRGKAESKR